MKRIYQRSARLSRRQIGSGHHCGSFTLALLVLASVIAFVRAEESNFRQTPSASAELGAEVPRAWDPEALKGLELPIAGLGQPPQVVSAEYYYRIPVRTIYKSYDVYHPDREPPDYWNWLSNQEPEILWDAIKSPKLETEADWIKAGELVFDAAFPTGNGSIAQRYDTIPVRDAAWYEKTGAPLTIDGKLPFYRYIVVAKGKIQVGTLSCAMCHTRVLPDKTVLKGAQGNFPFDKAFAFDYRKSNDPVRARKLELRLYGAPWHKPDPLADLDGRSIEEIAMRHEAVPPGVLMRHGTGSWSPVQIPDLIGVKDRRYLDHTGLQRNHGLGDLMRYAALNQGGDFLSFFGTFNPVAAHAPGDLPDPKTQVRHSDSQLYALAKYLYSLQSPANPHLPTTTEQRTTVDRGRRIFDEEGCARCHDPKEGYTNNKLIAAPGFVIPSDHPAREDIMRQRVGTDATLATRTRRGTGLYKVPSLRGVWYRSHFEHNGSCASLEDWFDPRRLQNDYVPTGWQGPSGTKTRAVKGHEYGLDLSDEDRKALVAFLKTL